MNTLKLNQLEKKHLSEREMNQVQGGFTECNCACAYENDGGSSTVDNAKANAKGGLSSPEDPKVTIVDDIWYDILSPDGN